MSIKIEMLRCFRTVADHGSLADAAAELGRTASAVSMMLKQFEDHVGAPLFESARKSRLTPLGALVLVEAQRELDHFERTLAAIDGLSRAEIGHVRLAVTPSVAQTVLPTVLRRFIAAHPQVRIDLSDSDSATVQRELAAERADIGLASLGPMPGLDRQLLFTDPFGLVCRADHRLARGWDQLGWSDLDGENFIANGLCKHIRDDGFAPVLAAARLMVRNTASLLGLVRAGVGVTLLPRRAVPPEAADLAFLPLGDSRARREVWMLTQPAPLLIPAAQALAQTLRTQASDATLAGNVQPG